MREYLTLGGTPYSEDCVQVSNTEDYLPAMTKECYRFMKMLDKRFPIPVGVDAHFGIKSFSHDFGTYKEVCLFYEDTSYLNQAFASFVDDNIPETWTDEAVLTFDPSSENCDEEDSNEH